YLSTVERQPVLVDEIPSEPLATEGFLSTSQFQGLVAQLNSPLPIRLEHRRFLLPMELLNASLEFVEGLEDLAGQVYLAVPAEWRAVIKPQRVVKQLGFGDHLPRWHAITIRQQISKPCPDGGAVHRPSWPLSEARE